MEKITIKEISKLAGVSPATVSAILNKRKYCFAGKKTKKKILKIVKELGYTPNFVAKSLKRGKTYTIGFIASFLNLETTLFRLEILSNMINKKGYHILIGCSYGKPENQENLLKEFYFRKVDGIILIPTQYKGENKFLKKLVDINFPILSYTEIEEVDIDYISTDYFKGGYLAGNYLAKRGCKNIGYLGPTLDAKSIKERFLGFKKAIIEAGLKVKEENFIFLQTTEYKEICEKSKRVIEKNVDGVFCSNDRIGLVFTKMAIEKNKKIPNEISIVGFDDIEFCQIFPIELTSIRHPIEKISKKILKVLITKIEKKTTTKNRELIPPELIIRET